jgi:glycosyltransferase involved in cell wall biosynthesis
VPSGNVLILVENLSVPMDRRVWQECLSLTRAGYEVFVICPQGASLDRASHETLQGVEIYRYPLTPARGGPWGYAREYCAALAHTAVLAARLGRRRRFAVVHACNPPDLLLLPALLLRLRGARLIFDHHDLVPELYLSRFGRGRDLGYKLTVLAERASVQLADVVISTNESYARVARTRGRKAPGDVFVVRSAPDLEEFRDVPPNPDLRRGKRYLLAYLGVMGPQDGVDHALRALASLARRRDDWHATFIGAGDVFDEMVALARVLGLAGRVEFTGRIPIDRVLEILSSAHIGLAPDPYNPLNDLSTMNKIVEYMAIGLPVVSYDLAESRISAADAGVYVGGSDPEEFAGAIDELLDDEVKRASMSESGRRRVRGELSWEHSERNLLRAYLRATERNGAEGRAGTLVHSSR